jgi:asparagine synthase (glutamine-hydrolysing)
MAHSLELRVPYLDHVLVEECSQIRASEKVAPGVNKPLLLKAAGHPVLQEVAQRKKSGFTFPFARWIRQNAGPLEDLALSGSPLERTAVQRCWEQFRTGKMHWSRVWGTVVLAACTSVRKPLTVTT